MPLKPPSPPGATPSSFLRQGFIDAWKPRGAAIDRFTPELDLLLEAVRREADADATERTRSLVEAALGRAATPESAVGAAYAAGVAMRHRLALREALIRAGWKIVPGKADPTFHFFQRPSEPGKWYSEEEAIEKQAELDRASSIHAPDKCAGHHCPFHNPSAHHMAGWRMTIRSSGLVERLCPHGVGHPDPDSVAYADSVSPPEARGAWGVHGCDGCCDPNKEAKR